MDPAAAVPQGAAAAPARPAPVPVYSLTPGKHNQNIPLDYTNGSGDIKLFYKGSSALPVIYDGTNPETFLIAVWDRSLAFSWESILTIPTSNGVKNLVKEHGQIPTSDIIAEVSTYKGQPTRQGQNCQMMYTCLRASIAPAKQADLDCDFLEYDQEGPTFLKYIIKDANNDTAAAAISVSMNMIALDKTMHSLQHDVKSFNVHCQGQFRIREQLGQPINNTDGIAYLAKGYGEVPVPQFSSYVEAKMNDHSDGTKTLTVKDLISLTTIKYNDLVRAGLWNLQPSVDVVALQCQLDAFKAQMTIDKKHKVKVKDKKKKERFALEAWAIKPPTDGTLTMTKNGKEFKWCSHHKKWCNHTAANCEAKKRTTNAVEEVDANAAAIEHELEGYFSEDSQD